LGNNTAIFRLAPTGMSLTDSIRNPPSLPFTTIPPRPRGSSISRYSRGKSIRKRGYLLFSSWPDCVSIQGNLQVWLYKFSRSKLRDIKKIKPTTRESGSSLNPTEDLEAPIGVGDDPDYLLRLKLFELCLTAFGEPVFIHPASWVVFNRFLYKMSFFFQKVIGS
jgi:hypothetical protein